MYKISSRKNLLLQVFMRNPVLKKLIFLMRIEKDTSAGIENCNISRRHA